MAANSVRRAVTDGYERVIAFAIDLGGTYRNMGNLNRERGQVQASLEWYNRAAQVIEVALERSPRHAAGRKALRNVFWSRAVALDNLGRHVEAVADWEHAIEFDSGGRRNYFRILRALSLARTGDHEQASGDAKTLAEGAKDIPVMLYNCACVYSLAIVCE
jgi:tetratricopeptide (TPR) repeat protein